MASYIIGCLKPLVSRLEMYAYGNDAEPEAESGLDPSYLYTHVYDAGIDRDPADLYGVNFW